MTTQFIEAIIDRKIAIATEKILKELRKPNKSEPLAYPYTAEEKAQQLHISVSRLYKIKDSLHYRKEAGRRRLMFA